MVVRRRGLTLVEVLVAVVLCGAGVAVASMGIAAAVRAEDHAEDLTLAARHVELLLARLDAGVLPLEEAEGDFTAEGHPELSWALTLTPGDVEGLQVVHVAVSWATPAGPRDLVVTREVFVDPLAGTR